MRPIRYLALSLMASIHISAQDNKALLLFGGEGHQKFLGCLSCSYLWRLDLRPQE